jgi:hypothetical protein
VYSQIYFTSQQKLFQILGEQAFVANARECHIQFLVTGVFLSRSALPADPGSMILCDQHQPAPCHEKKASWLPVPQFQVFIRNVLAYR